MKIKNKFIIFILVFLTVLTLGCAQQSIVHDEFAACLTEKGAKMYGTEWCSHCKDQKAMFGASFKKVNYIDCEIKKADCAAAGVSGYPTWILADGSKLIGAQSLKTLADKTGCSLPNLNLPT